MALQKQFRRRGREQGGQELRWQGRGQGWSHLGLFTQQGRVQGGQLSDVVRESLEEGREGKRERGKRE
jgi:hypothetical protein